MDMRRILAIVIATACCAVAEDPSFEVASIRTRTDGTGEIWTLKPFRFEFSGPRMTIENFRLSDLITYAYDIKDYELSGAPHWADIDRYNISASVADGVTLNREAARPMMRALLADRFQFKAHTEMKEMPVYALVVAKGGTKISVSSPGAEKRLTLQSKGKSEVMTVTSGDMAQLASHFSKRNGVDRPVIDKTDLAQSYDYKLEWGDDSGADIDSKLVSIFTAFQEQLGLKLQPAKAPVPVLIVDHVAKPSEN
jgi:bla regulator protein BlaR1